MISEADGKLAPNSSKSLNIYYNIYYENVRGLNSKLDVLVPNVSDCDYSVIALSEAGSLEINSSELFH